MTYNHNRWLISKELSQMEHYLELLITAVDDNKKQFSLSIQELSENDLSDILPMSMISMDDFIEEIKNDVRDDFPRRLYSSFVVSWYSFMETRLLNFCSHHKLKVSVSVQDQKPLGAGIRRARNFLKRAANYEINNIHWTELVQVGKIRNLIVHSNGKLPYSRVKPKSKKPFFGKNIGGNIYLDTDENQALYLETRKILEYRGLFYVTPNLDYSKHLIRFGTEFFENLYETFEEKHLSSDKPTS